VDNTMDKMKKKKYRYKIKSLLTPLFREEGITIYDNLYVDINLDANTFHIYCKLRYYGGDFMCFPICFDFTDTKCEEAVKSRMMNIMQNKPYISANELSKITGHSTSTINKYYMILKRKLY
jgi:hypothetical protein